MTASRIEYEVEGPNNEGGFHIKRVEWTDTDHGVNRAAILHSKHATLEEANAALDKLVPG